MIITAVDCRSVRLPSAKRRSLPRADDPIGSEPETSTIFVAQIRTDADLIGTGWVITRQSRIIQTIIEDLIVPGLVGQDAHSTERLFAQTKTKCPEIARGGSESMAYAA